jgi:hypothetical protein
VSLRVLPKPDTEPAFCFQSTDDVPLAGVFITYFEIDIPGVDTVVDTDDVPLAGVFI